MLLHNPMVIILQLQSLRSRLAVTVTLGKLSDSPSPLISVMRGSWGRSVLSHI
jgi:hypothetical protein